MSEEFDEKLMRVRVPKGMHLDRSQDTPGANRGTLRDAENRLSGHVEMFEVDESELAGGDPDGAHEYDCDYDYDVEDDDEEDADLASLLALLGIAAVAYGTGKAVSHSRQKKAHQQQEQARKEQEQAVRREEQARARGERRARRREAQALTRDVRALRRKERARKKEIARQIESAAAAEVLADRTSARVLPPPGWYEVDSSRLRWWDGKEWTDHFTRTESSGAAATFEPTGSSELESSAPNGHSHQAGPTMSRDEWTERARMMLLARAFSEEQWRLLANARIKDADAATLQCQRDLRALTPQEFSDRISAMLESNPDLLSATRALAPAGWYDDGTGTFRWWDSLRWTEHTQPVLVEALAAGRSAASPGWYDDGSGRQRWWTGQQWQ